MRSAHVDFSLPIAVHPFLFNPIAPPWDNRVRQKFPGAANGVVYVPMKDIAFCLRVGRLDRGNVAEQPGFTFFNGNTKASGWFGVASIQDGEEFLAQFFQALVIKIANHNYRCWIIGGVFGKGLSISTEQLGKLVEQKALPRIGTALEASGNAADSPVFNDPECMLIADDLWHQNVECLFAGLVFDKYLEVHPITSRRDSRCTQSPAQGQTLLDHVVYLRIFACPSNSRETVRALFQDPDFLRLQRIDEIGLVRCDKNLRTAFASAGVFAEFFRQSLQELVIQAVLRFFDAEKRRGCRGLRAARDRRIP